MQIILAALAIASPACCFHIVSFRFLTRGAHFIAIPTTQTLLLHITGTQIRFESMVLTSLLLRRSNAGFLFGNLALTLRVRLR
jgi:hypothetical protein